MSIDLREREAARTGLRSINSTSIQQNVEYFFLIYRSGQDYRSTTPATSGLQDGVAEDDITAEIKKVPTGAKVTAFAHTHGKDLAGDFTLIFSPEDIKFARDHHWNSYLATPSSELVMLDHSDPKDQFPRMAL